MDVTVTHGWRNFGHIVGRQIHLFAPDLLVTGLSVNPSSGLQSGGSLTVTVGTTNNGLGSASNSFADQLQIVNTTTGQTLVYGTNPLSQSAQGPWPRAVPLPSSTPSVPDGAAGAGYSLSPSPMTSTTRSRSSTRTARPSRAARRRSPQPRPSPLPDLHATGVWSIRRAFACRRDGDLGLERQQRRYGPG